MSKVILGAMEMGRNKFVEESSCFELLDIFLKRGCNELDTALMYTGGNSEKIIGKYVTEKGIRDQVVIASKANPFTSRLTKDNVRKQALTSLESLRTPCMDIFYLHAPDHVTPLEETLQAVQLLYEEGKFKELGLSNFAAWEVADVYHICKRNGWVLPTVYQGMYNPITRMVEGELFPAIRKFGLRFYAYNPLAGGILSGRYKKEDMEKEQEGRFWTVGGPLWTKGYRDRFWRESVFDGIELIKRSLDEAYGCGQVSLVSAVFRWMNHHSKMQSQDAIIIGCGSKEHLIANMDACEEGPLDSRVVEAFDKAWQLDKANCATYYR